MRVPKALVDSGHLNQVEALMQADRVEDAYAVGDSPVLTMILGLTADEIELIGEAWPRFVTGGRHARRVCGQSKTSQRISRSLKVSTRRPTKVSMVMSRSGTLPRTKSSLTAGGL